MNKKDIGILLLSVLIFGAYIIGNVTQGPFTTYVTETTRLTDRRMETVTATATVWLSKTVTTKVSVIEYWRIVTGFSGAGSLTGTVEHVTGTFKINSSSWRIRWNYTAIYGQITDFAFSVYSTHREGEVSVGGVTSRALRDSGVLYLSDAGTYYIRVSLSRYATFSLVIEELVRTGY